MISQVFVFLSTQALSKSVDTTSSALHILNLTLLFAYI